MALYTREPAVPDVPGERRRRFSSCELLAAVEDIPRPTEWTIEGPRHAVIVHLAGEMHALRTELAGVGGSSGLPRPGELWSVPAQRRYRSCAHGDRIHYAVLGVDPDIELGGDRPLRTLAPLAGVHDPFLHEAAAGLVALGARDDDVARLYGDSVAVAVVAHLAMHYGDGQVRGRWQDEGAAFPAAVARRLAQFVRERLGEPLRLAQLAVVAGMPEYRFTATFRRTFGTTPWQFVIVERLRAARELLRDGDLGITEIALRCGFASHSHLTRCCRQHFGRAPRELRRT